MKTKKHELLPTFPSLAATSGATGIPTAVLKHAKRSGCVAFDQAGRVHLEPLLRWLFASGNDDAGVDWQVRFQRARAIALETKIAKARGDLIDVAAWVGYVQVAAGECRKAINDQIDTAPQKFAATDGDMAACREVLKGVLWDGFWPAINTHLLEAARRLNADQLAVVKQISEPPTTNTEK